MNTIYLRFPMRLQYQMSNLSFIFQNGKRGLKFNNELKSWGLNFNEELFFKKFIFQNHI